MNEVTFNERPVVTSSLRSPLLSACKTGLPSLKNNSPMVTSSLDVCKSPLPDPPTSDQGLLSAENARVFPIKTPGDFGSANPLVEEFRSVGSSIFKIPSYLISSSVAVSSVPLYFLPTKKVAFSIFDNVPSKISFISPPPR